MRDIPVAAHDGLAARGGQLCHPRRKTGHEALLLELTIGTGLAGLDVEAGHGQTRRIGLHVTAVGAELVGVHQPRRLDRIPREDRNTAAPLDMRFGRREVPTVSQDRRKGRRVGVPPACEGDWSPSARVSCRQTTSAGVAANHGSSPRLSADRSLIAARMPLTLMVETIT
jgi:hypothetical protein